MSFAAVVARISQRLATGYYWGWGWGRLFASPGQLGRTAENGKTTTISGGCQPPSDQTSLLSPALPSSPSYSSFTHTPLLSHLPLSCRPSFVCELLQTLARRCWFLPLTLPTLVAPSQHRPSLDRKRRHSHCAAWPPSPGRSTQIAQRPTSELGTPVPCGYLLVPSSRLQ